MNGGHPFPRNLAVQDLREPAARKGQEPLQLRVQAEELAGQGPAGGRQVSRRGQALALLKARRQERELAGEPLADRGEGANHRVVVGERRVPETEGRALLHLFAAVIDEVLPPEAAQGGKQGVDPERR